jgi:AraC-like DNA-binding protein
MHRPVISCGAPPPKVGGSGWVYWRPMIEGVLEFGISHGGSQELATHFHEEVQVTFVLAGHRSFRIGGRIIGLAAGQWVCIPARVPHQSLAGSSGLTSLNAYVPAGAYSTGTMMKDIERLSPLLGSFRWEEAVPLTSVQQASDEAIAILQESSESVGQLAMAAGKSREGFSRRFAERYGMPPHAFRLVSRLNRAREMLRAGEAIASAAAEAGFADQSHLGRCFRRAFGVSPARYRSG